MPDNANADKYNLILPESTDRVLCFRVDKVISKEGYTENALPRLQKMIEEYGEMRILIDYEKFQGWEEDAAKIDMMTTASLGKKLAKLALVNPPESEVFHRKIKGSILSGEMKIFAKNEYEKALEWVKA